jgi:hypothetical protein
MAHELEYREDRNAWSFAFIGDRSAICHKKGQQASQTWTLEQWKVAANQDFSVRKVPLVGIPADSGAAIPCETHELLIRRTRARRCRSCRAIGSRPRTTTPMLSLRPSSRPASPP